MRMSSKPKTPILFVILLALLLAGCRRNLLRVSTNPPDAQVFVEGRPVWVEDGDRKRADRIDRKKAKRKALNEKEIDFDSRRKQFQSSPVDYEFKSLNAGYSIYSQKKGYQPAYHVEFLKPKWYELPPLDFFVDLLPFTITDKREVELTLNPENNPGPVRNDGS